MDPMNTRCVPKGSKLLHGLLCMLFVIGEKEDLFSVMLKQMSNDSKPNTRRSASDNINLVFLSEFTQILEKAKDVSSTFPSRLGMSSVSGSNLLLVKIGMIFPNFSLC